MKVGNLVNEEGGGTMQNAYNRDQVSGENESNSFLVNS